MELKQGTVIVMSMYFERCSHCNMIIRSGHGTPLKHLGNPLKRFKYCGKPYIDTDTIEWNVSPLYRKIGYLFANNRWASFFIPFILCPVYPFIAICVVVILLLLFNFYVKGKVKKELPASIERTSDVEYIKILKECGYPLKRNI